MTKRESLMVNMFKIKAIKFGTFKLKSGMISPVYVDLRVLVSYPKVLKEIAGAYVLLLKNIPHKRMIAIPYTALPITANISAINNKPWIYTRKEVKSYGINRPVEGEYNEGERLVMIDDMITTGASKIETIKPLLGLGLEIKDIVVLVDREQGGREYLTKLGYRFHAVFTITEWLKTLLKMRKITQKTYDEVITYLALNRVK